MPYGLYEHYKGHKYVVYGIALHSETLEPFVQYHRFGNPADNWVRPKHMFDEQVLKDGARVPRFKYLGPVPKP